MLHIGDNQTVPQEDIVIILPDASEDGRKSKIVLADGRVVYSLIVSTTLKRRLSSDPRAE